MAPLDPSSSKRRRQPVRPCIGTLTLRRKHWIELDGRFVIGEGGAELLRAVDRQGSLAQGARHIGWSYRHAWGYVRRAEAVLGVSLVSTKPGKGAARGAVITRRRAGDRRDAAARARAVAACAIQNERT